MKNKLAYIIILISIIACNSIQTQKFEGLGGLEWGSDILTVREYFASKKEFTDKYYKFDRDSRILTLQYGGGNFLGEQVEMWKIKIKADSMFSYEIEITKDIEGNFPKMKEQLIQSLGKPDSENDTLVTWKNIEKPNEKYSLHRLINSIVFTATKI